MRSCAALPALSMALSVPASRPAGGAAQLAQCGGGGCERARTPCLPLRRLRQPGRSVTFRNTSVFLLLLLFLSQHQERTEYDAARELGKDREDLLGVRVGRYVAIAGRRAKTPPKKLSVDLSCAPSRRVRGPTRVGHPNQTRSALLSRTSIRDRADLRTSLLG